MKERDPITNKPKKVTDRKGWSHPHRSEKKAFEKEIPDADGPLVQSAKRNRASASHRAGQGRA